MKVCSLYGAGFYYIPGGTAASVLAANPSNNSNNGPVALFSFDAANPSSTDHFCWFGPEGTAADTPTNDTTTNLHLHIADKVMSTDADFDAFKIGNSFSK